MSTRIAVALERIALTLEEAHKLQVKYLESQQEYKMPDLSPQSLLNRKYTMDVDLATNSISRTVKSFKSPQGTIISVGDCLFDPKTHTVYRIINMRNKDEDIVISAKNLITSQSNTDDVTTLNCDNFILTKKKEVKGRDLQVGDVLAYNYSSKTKTYHVLTKQFGLNWETTSKDGQSAVSGIESDKFYCIHRPIEPVVKMEE